MHLCHCAYGIALTWYSNVNYHVHVDHISLFINTRAHRVFSQQKKTLKNAEFSSKQPVKLGLTRVSPFNYSLSTWLYGSVKDVNNWKRLK